MDQELVRDLQKINAEQQKLLVEFQQGKLEKQDYLEKMSTLIEQGSVVLSACE